MSTPIYHKHHIVPRHMGGSDDSSNLIKLTIEEKGTNNPFYGKTHSKEFKEKQRLNKLGKPQSEETKAKYNRKDDIIKFNNYISPT